ncbi:probable inactive 1-aminocyclopropane-1-carboxylate synthase-like protein 2 [Diadema setosum]|uniref:probable inactive 1-aminocyclopropane-1-carboxylate synthase-like protein 2 n=1 Tax=Diadema setosum TaxID=31175 RepID=UPI003B3B25B0
MTFFDLSSRINRMLSFETPPALGPSPFNIENNYHKDDNPRGIIQLAMAENRLLGDLMLEKVRTVDLSKVSRSTLVYQDGRGMADFRKVLAEFLADVAKAPQKLDPDKIRVCNGVLPLIANLLCIICDEGDGRKICPVITIIIKSTGFESQVSLSRKQVNDADPLLFAPGD